MFVKIIMKTRESQKNFLKSQSILEDYMLQEGKDSDVTGNCPMSSIVD